MGAFLSYIVILFLFSVRALGAQDLALLTSFPEKFSDEFVQEFTAQNPAYDVRVLNKNTIASVDEILRGNPRNFGVFWASAPEAFAILQRADAFAPLEVCGREGPSSVEPFAISAVGWATRTDMEGLAPREWNDLLRPQYQGKIAMARPSRSGSTHMIVEQLLQVRGWDEGWAYWLELAGNFSTLTARSFGVPEGLISRRFDIGFTIDYLAYSHGKNLQFHYGRPVVLATAQIGILKQAQNMSAACDFVRMVTSPEGQVMLLQPGIGRVPYDAQTRESFEDQLPVGITQTLKLPWLDYNANASGDRYWAVNTLFDLMITEVLPKRRDLWRRYYMLDDRVSPDRLAHLKRTLTSMPISWSEAVQASQSIDGGLRGTALVSLGDTERQVVGDWRARIEASLREADAELTRLEVQARH